MRDDTNPQQVAVVREVQSQSGSKAARSLQEFEIAARVPASDMIGLRLRQLLGED